MTDPQLDIYPQPELIRCSVTDNAFPESDMYFDAWDGKWFHKSQFDNYLVMLGQESDWTIEDLESYRNNLKTDLKLK